MIRVRDLAPYLCPPARSVRDALGQLNATTHLFQLVADAEGRLLGTLTDGDVRRAILNGVSLDAQVAECMNARFVSGYRGAGRDNLALLHATPRRVDFLPVVDEGGRLVEVLVRDDMGGGVSRALVMAGGFGRRLGSRTLTTPKPLLPVGGRPILDHILTRLEDAGVGSIEIAVHYLADQIKSFVRGRDNRADVRLLEEEAPLGTAGALGLLDEPQQGPVLVVNGDVMTSLDVAALHNFHVLHGFDGTVGVARHEIDVPFGVVRHGQDGLFAGIDEKPRISNFIAAGVYYLSPQFSGLVPRGHAMDMPELLNLGREIGLRAGLFPIHEYWADLGRPDDLERADHRHRATSEAAK